MLALPLRVVHCLVGTQKVGAGHVRSGYGRPALLRFSVRRAAAPCVWSDPALRKTWTWSIRRVDTELYSRLIKINIAKCDFPLKSVAVWNISSFFFMNTAKFLSYRVRIRGSRGTNPRISRNEFEALVERIRGSGGANPRILWNESADLGEQIRSAGSLDQATVVAIQGRYKNLLPRLFILLLITS